MAKDHFIPKAYLRGFTREYLLGKKGGQLVVYNASSGNYGTLSINNYVACEPEFYNGHPLDKHWSRTIEQTWPNVRERLKARETGDDLLDELFWFVSAQFIRTSSYMNRVSRAIGWNQRKKMRVPLDGRPATGIFVDTTSTTDVMNEVQQKWPDARASLGEDYVWTVYHNSSSRLFLTSDDPCQLDDKTQDVVMPLALDVAIVGRIVVDGESSHLRHCDASPEMIKKINQGVVRRCKSLVYSHHESKELRRFVNETSRHA